MTGPQTITMCDRALNLSTPVFQSVGFLDVGSNAVTIQPAVGTDAYSITLPASLPAAGTTSMLTTNSTGITAWGNSITDLTTANSIVAEGGLAVGNAAKIELQPAYSATTGGAVAVHEYLNIKTPALTGAVPPTVTQAYVMNFDAIPGTHSALDAATVKTTPTGVDAWVKISVENPVGTFTTYFVPAFLSKTA